MKKQHPSAFALIVLTLMGILTPVTRSFTSSKQRDHSHKPGSKRLPEAGVEVQVLEHGKVKCRSATSDERLISARDHAVPVREIITPTPRTLNAQTSGLSITLRGTPQLEAFPLAKQAFLKAAAAWQSIIQNPISIVVDVDFGPTRFGEPYPEDLLGSTEDQLIGDEYATVRDKLIAGASNAKERALYDSLPASTVPTDLGDTTAVFAPATLLRALGLIDPVANPDTETADLGPPPTIGLNSAFEYDFDQSDGIDEDKVDFTAVAEHEIGHLLGFFTLEAHYELFPDDPFGVSVWDLFRFRPGVTRGGLASTPRVLSSGGIQVFFAGGREVQLSTGRPDNTGGDGQQGSHWKDNELTGEYIGVMDPTAGEGEDPPITASDLEALDAMGYTIVRDEGGVPLIRNLAASLDGDVLSLFGAAADSEEDISQAQVKLLDGGGLIVGETDQFAVDFGGSPEVTFRLTITDLADFPTAVQVLLLLTDQKGQTSKPFITAFDQQAPGGPVLSNVSLNGRKLKIVGQSLSGSIEIEINGVVVSRGSNESEKKAFLKGDSASLNLRSGPNRVRVRNGALWSNIYIFDL